MATDGTRLTDYAELDAKTEEAIANLTEKQGRFVREYLLDLNATQAAIRAGYSKKTAGQIGFELLKKPEIEYALNMARSLRAERTETSADWVIKNLRALAYDAWRNGDRNVAARCFEMIGKHHKAFTDRVELFEPERLNRDELRRALAERNAEIAALTGSANPDTSGVESTRH